MYLSPEIHRQLAQDRQAALQHAGRAPLRWRLRLRRRARRPDEGRDGPYTLAA